MESNSKIAINAASAKMGGAVNYLANLLRHLPPPESGYQFYVLLPSETARALQDVPGNIRLCPVPDKNIGGWRRVWWEQVTLRRLLVREKVDVLFSTANFAMFRCPVSQILLVRNALYFSKLYQQIFLPRHCLKMRIAFGLRRWLICRSVKSADIVMTPTRAMLDELRAYVDIPKSKVLVSPYGVEPPDSPPSQPEREKASQPHGVVSLLYVSLYSEHKNLNTLLKAMPILNKNGSRRFLLKTTVDPAWEGGAWTVTHQDDLALAMQSNVAPWVQFCGPLGRLQAQELYLSADISVFPSLCESFGHPMVEAMAAGLPIVASDTPVNREICGEAAVYFRPLDPEHLAQQICSLASEDELRARLSTASNHRVRAFFDWNSHVRRILEAAKASANGFLP